IAVFVGIDLGARIIEEFILDKGADIGREKVIGTGNHIERQICVTLSAASVNWDSAGYGVYDLGARGLRIVNADPRTDIRLEPSIPRRESHNEIPQERAS